MSIFVDAVVQLEIPRDSGAVTAVSMQGHDQGQLPGAVVAAGEPEFSSPLIRPDVDHGMV